MKLPIRFFGIGLLTATLIFSIILYFFGEDIVSLEDESIENISAYLEEQGYHVVTQEQYISLAVKAREEQQKNNEEENSSTEKDSKENKDAEEEAEDNEKNNDNANNNEEELVEEETEEDEETEVVHKYTLTVVPNMLGPEVGELLEKNNIIDDGQAFAQYLVEHGYARYIQLGDHELSSDMTFYQIAEIIAGR